MLRNTVNNQIHSILSKLNVSLLVSNLTVRRFSNLKPASHYYKSSSSTFGGGCGLVGLPNVGKSTLFNALTQSNAAAVANYPFCTIEPNVGRVAVPDEMLFKLAQQAKAAKVIPVFFDFVDIAGLIKGASQGQGMGNKFLSSVRGVSLLVHVVRCFEDDVIAHVDETIDPVRDIDTIFHELLFADLESVEKAVETAKAKASRAGSKSSVDAAEIQRAVSVSKRVLDVLEAGKRSADVLISPEEWPYFRSLHLLTAKPFVFCCNAPEEDVLTGNAMTRAVEKKVEELFSPAALAPPEVAETKPAKTAKQPKQPKGAAVEAIEEPVATLPPVVIMCAKLEAEVGTTAVEGSIAEADEEKRQLWEALGWPQGGFGLTRLIPECRNQLRHRSYFTVGKKEARAWPFIDGTTSKQAAGVIHSDLEKGFVRAEIVSASELYAFGGDWDKAKKLSKIRSEGASYIMKDQDVCVFHSRDK
eukprot:TRINITY_DN8533_c0_g1_i1.p1 TRINITY_DN8533_c0_g1~~TRINITY_DN8533_c0_g1_i1.p1  ORF type:complete len:472 (-),score=191.93 TRINITY_DN8533_c0_g1_i1:25-1440(-)